MRNKRGITLVSLVVTIIVLIILAGVSINLTLGENGIITMAKKARENMELAKVDEERQLNELYLQLEQEGLSGEISYDAIAKLAEFKREIASAISDMGVATSENADLSTMTNNIRNISTNKEASSITYDNSNSALTSTNVQGAVDELDNEIDSFNNSLNYKIGLPNYSTSTQIVISNSQTGSFTAPQSGIVYLNWKATDGFITITVNDTQVSQLVNGGGTSDYVQMPFTIMLSQGDILRWYGNNSNVFVTTTSTFFPFK